MTAYIPKVSIGMPVYNGEKTIRESLDSLLAQNLSDFEIIISDNASTDSTAAICQEYCSRDARVRYVRQSSNLGAISNFQFVLDAAIGEYFMWAAADDMWSSNWLAIMAKHAGVGRMCFGVWQIVGSDGMPVGDIHYNNVMFPKSKLGRMLGLILPYPVGYNHLIYGLYPTNSLKAIRAGTALGYLPSKIAPHGNEIIPLFLLLQDHEIIIDDSAIMYYRKGGCSTIKIKTHFEKVRNLICDPIYALIGTIQLLTLPSPSKPFSYALYILYPLVGLFRLAFTYLKTLGFVIRGCGIYLRLNKRNNHV